MHLKKSKNCFWNNIKYYYILKHVLNFIDPFEKLLNLTIINFKLPSSRMKGNSSAFPCGTR